MTSQTDEQPSRQGIGYALGAYVLWGAFPVYWKLLQHVGALEILGHRIVWSLAFLVLVLVVRGNWSWVAKLSGPVVGRYFLASGFLALNWGLYIWAVNTGHVVETALGYFINPLINVLFGALWLGERPRLAQWGAFGVAAAGVGWLTWAHGSLPWIALVLAFSFAFYGLIKKRATLGALEGLSLETALWAPFGLGFLIWLQWQGQGAFGRLGWADSLLLAGAGVASSLPLLFFAAALRRLPLTLIGVIQYLAPTIQFLLGVFLYHEPFGGSQLVGFVLIWTALILYTAEGFWHRHRQRLGVQEPV